MTSETIDLLNGIGAIACLLVPASEAIYKKDLKQISAVGWALFVVAIYLGFVVIANYHVKGYEKKEAKREADSTKRADDSVMRKAQKEYDDSLKSYHNYTTELLARYGLKVDTAQRRIEQIVHDSLRGTPDPILGIADVTAKSYAGYMEIRLELISKDAPSKDFSTDILICTSTDLAGPYINFDIISGFQTQKILATGDIIPQTFYFTKDANPFNLMFFLVKGDYKSIKDERRRPIDALMGFNIISNTSFEITGRTEMGLRNYFEESLKNRTNKKNQQIRKPIFQLRQPNLN